MPRKTKRYVINDAQEAASFLFETESGKAFKTSDDIFMIWSDKQSIWIHSVEHMSNCKAQFDNWMRTYGHMFPGKVYVRKAIWKHYRRMVPVLDESFASLFEKSSGWISLRSCKYHFPTNQYLQHNHDETPFEQVKQGYCPLFAMDIDIPLEIDEKQKTKLEQTKQEVLAVLKRPFKQEQCFHDLLTQLAHGLAGDREMTCCYLSGPPDSGKSSLMNILNEVFGNDLFQQTHPGYKLYLAPSRILYTNEMFLGPPYPCAYVEDLLDRFEKQAPKKAIWHPVTSALILMVHKPGAPDDLVKTRNSKLKHIKLEKQATQKKEYDESMYFVQEQNVRAKFENNDYKWALFSILTDYYHDS